MLTSYCNARRLSAVLITLLLGGACSRADESVNEVRPHQLAFSLTAEAGQNEQGASVLVWRLKNEGKTEIRILEDYGPSSPSRNGTVLSAVRIADGGHSPLVGSGIAANLRGLPEIKLAPGEAVKREERADMFFSDFEGARRAGTVVVFWAHTLHVLDAAGKNFVAPSNPVTCGAVLFPKKK